MARAITTGASLVWRDGLLLLIVTLGLIPALWDQRLERWEGAVLAALLVGYLVYLFYKREAVMDEEIPTAAPKVGGGGAREERGAPHRARHEAAAREHRAKGA